MQSSLADNSTSELPIANRGIFARICHYITSGAEKIGDIGEHLITSAQKDLYNLKSELINSWKISPEEKDTIALYATAVIGRIVYTPVLLGITLVASLCKIATGSVCMLLGFRVLTLCSRLFNTLWEFVKQGGEMLIDLGKQLLTNAWDFTQNLVNKFCDICARIAASIMRNIIWVCDKLKVALECVWQQIAQFVNCIYKAISHVCTFLTTIANNIFLAIGDVCKAGLSIVNGAINAVCILGTAIVMALGALFFESGAANIISGLAKCFFALNQGIFTTVGVLLDGAQDCGQNLQQALCSLVGYRPVAQVMQQPLLSARINEEIDIEQNLDNFSLDSERPSHPGLVFVGPSEVSNTFCRQSLHDAAYDFNSLIADVGVGIEQSYLNNKQLLFAGYRKRSEVNSEPPRSMLRSNRNQRALI